MKRKKFPVRERPKLEDGERKMKNLKYMRRCAFEIIRLVMHPALRQRMTGGRQQTLSNIARVHVNRYQQGGPECNWLPSWITTCQPFYATSNMVINPHTTWKSARLTWKLRVRYYRMAHEKLLGGNKIGNLIFWLTLVSKNIAGNNKNQYLFAQYVYWKSGSKPRVST